MKKTLTVNLGGTVFHIDEDAYELLDKYLSNLRIHFHREEGSDEIMDDFELRISELLGERIRLGYNVISIDQIEEIIKRMGKPEEIFEEEGKEEEKKEQKKETTSSSSVYAEEPKKTVKKRFMRDPDNRILGGVAGGFAAYMDWDPTAVRIALFLLIFLYGVTVPIYFLLWIIVPMARTATERLQMKGESVTIENIGKTVTDSFEKVSKNVNDYVSSGKPRSALQKIADVFVEVLGLIIKVLLVLIGIILFPPLLVVLFAIVVVIIAMVFGGGIGLLSGIFPGANWDMLSAFPHAALMVASFSTILTIGIPTFLIFYAIGSQFFKFTPLSPNVRWVLVVLFIVSFFVNVFFASKYGLAFWDGWGWFDGSGEWAHRHMSWHPGHCLRNIGWEIGHWLL